MPIAESNAVKCSSTVVLLAKFPLYIPSDSNFAAKPCIVPRVLSKLLNASTMVFGIALFPFVKFLYSVLRVFKSPILELRVSIF